MKAVLRNRLVSFSGARVSGLLAAVLCIAGWQARGAPVAYEGFNGTDYANGVALGGLNGGTGWSGAWSANSSCQISSAGMAYASGPSILLVTGGKLQCLGGSGERIVATGIGSPARKAGVVDASNNVGADGTSVWVSFLGECPVADSDFGISFTRSGASVAFPQTGIIGLGGAEQWRFWPQANLTGVSATTKVLLVWRLDFGSGNNDYCRVWINPVPGTVPSDASASLSGGGGDWSFDRIDFGGGSSTTLWFDELRIGTTYADVAPRDPVPPAAPSSPSPVDGAINVVTATQFDWSDCLGAESYDFYIWPTAGSRPSIPSTTVTASQYVPPGFLTPFTPYSWQVVANNPYGATPGPTWTFTSGDGRPAAPTAPSPADAASGVLVDTVLDWSDCIGAKGYQVFVWLSSGTRPSSPLTNVQASTFTAGFPLTGNTNYSWQIVATNQYGATTGPVWTFATGDRMPGYLVPWPKTVLMRTGNFALTAATRVVAEDAALLPLARVITNDIFVLTGLPLANLQGAGQSGDIVLRLTGSLTGEAYTLEVSSANVVVSGGNYQAAAWGSVTLLQAIDTSVNPACVPQMLIQDAPAAPLRTVMWDIARFFHPLETLYELVDLHRMYKVTYCHLYMSADGLFTFGTTAYPGLPGTNDGGVPYGGSPGFYLPASGSRLYYTKAELTALVTYARDRGVVIVPEIDTPSWAAFMTSRKPEVFSSVGGTIVTHDININYTNAVAAMGVLMGELADVFATSPYIHIGADEVPSSEFESYPYWAQNAAANSLANGGEGVLWYMRKLADFAAARGHSAWAWSAPGTVGKGFDMPTNMVYTAWGYDDGQNASIGGYRIMRAAGGHVAGMGQANRPPPYNRCLLYRPAQGIYNRLTPLFRFIGAPDAIYTDLQPNFLPLTGRENKIAGAHIMEWETPYEIEVPAMRLSLPALGEPTWNQETSSRRNWDNFLARQSRADQLYEKVMRPVRISASTQVDAKDICFTGTATVTMTALAPSYGSIRYTVGTDYKNSWYNFPTAGSTLYTGPFTIAQSSVIHARLFDASGKPIGNPVIKGFYKITPKTHYRHYFTGPNPAADFESTTPIASSVMGQMDTDASHEDVRFGDTDHRTVFTGSLNLTAAGAYTFSPNFSAGQIYIDRNLIPNETATNLTAGEHLFKVITAPTGTGSPYSFSGPGYGSGSDLNLLPKTLSSAAQVFPGSCVFGGRGTSDGASAKQLITIINHNVFANMVLTGVQLAGANPGDFVISEDSGQTVLPPGGERVLSVRFDPASIGAKSASVQVISLDLSGGSQSVTLSGTGVASSIPTAPATPTPASGAMGVPISTALDWTDSAGGDGYRVYFWLSSDTKPGTPTATTTDSQWTPTATLLHGTEYKWQVVATNIYGSATGAVWSFTTTTEGPPPAPATPIPASGATKVPASALLSWTGSAEADGYAVYLWLSSGTQPATPTARVGGTSWRAPANLISNTNYSWQVVATNAYGSTPGAVWTFRTASTLVTNLADGDILRYPLAMVDGIYAGTTLQITADPAKTSVSFTKLGYRFRCLADLQPGTNTITFTDSQGSADLRLVYTPATSADWRFKIWYVVPSDEASTPVDPGWFIHFGLQTKLMQSWMAEDQLRAGNGRATFYPEMDATNNVDVGMLVISQTRAEAEALGTGIFGAVYNQIPAAYRDGHHKNVAFTSVNFHALASGDLAYVGAYSPILPGRVVDIIPSLLSLNTAYDGLTFATYAGVTLHEISHTLNSIWHDSSPNNLMGGGNYDISEYFTLTYNQANNAAHSESAAATLGPLRDLAKWTRYLMSADPHAYADANITINIGAEYIDTSSPNPLALFYHYVPESAADLHTNLYASGAASFRKHVGEAYQELGNASPFNVMAVDTQCNMRYATFSGGVIPVLPVDDSYNVTGNTLNVIPAPGVLANEFNPSSSALTAVLATNTVHGTVAVGINGGFTYTPAAGYEGTDTFWYAACDAVSTDRLARVTLRVTIPPSNQPPVITITNPANSAVFGSGTAIVIGATVTDDVAVTNVAFYADGAHLGNDAATPYAVTWNAPSLGGHMLKAVAWDNAGLTATSSVINITVVAATPVITVDFVYDGLGGANGGVSAPCSSDTLLTGTTMKNADGNIFIGQTGPWNPLVVGGNNVNASSAISGFLLDGSGNATTVRLALGLATGLNNSLAGNWRTDFQSGLTGGGGATLRGETAYLYSPTLTANHYAWNITGLKTNTAHKLTFFGGGPASGTALNVAFPGTVAAVAAVRDSELDWNWTTVSSDASGTISGTFSDTGNNQTVGLYGMQIQAIPLAPPTPVISGITGPVNGQLHINGTADVAGNIVVWRATSLVAPVNWQPIQTNTVTTSFSIGVPMGSDLNAFYRLTGQ